METTPTSPSGKPLSLHPASAELGSRGREVPLRALEAGLQPGPTHRILLVLTVVLMAAVAGCQMKSAFPPGAQTVMYPPRPGAKQASEPEETRVADSSRGSAQGGLIVRGQSPGGYQAAPQSTTPGQPSSNSYNRGPMPVSGNVKPGQLSPRMGGTGASGGPYPLVAQNAPVAQPQPYGQESLPAPRPASQYPSTGRTFNPGITSDSATVPSLGGLEPSFLDPTVDGTINALPGPILPRTRQVPVDIYLEEARTGRFMIGGAVNSNAGVTGQIVVDERNFDITRFPQSFQDLFSGRAFRGAGQTFRLEAVPGEDYQRYMGTFSDPFLLGYLPFSFTANAFLYDRRYRDYDETRKGGRMLLGYRITPDLSLAAGVSAQNVDFRDPRITGIPEVDALVGEHELYSGQVRLVRDTRDIPFAPTEGSRLEISFEQVFGSFDYPRYQVDYGEYFLVRQRADGSGRHVLSYTMQTGFSGTDTPIFENFFAGGYTSLRGFRFRGASPRINNFIVGGRFQFLGSLEYKFPLTADDMLQAVTFVDFGTVERDIEINSENFRVSPGFGFRVSIPAMGPAPLAFDFGFPVAEAEGDERQIFSFFMGVGRF